jgi:hypothetical protein
MTDPQNWMHIKMFFFLNETCSKSVVPFDLEIPMCISPGLFKVCTGIWFTFRIRDWIGSSLKWTGSATFVQSAMCFLKFGFNSCFYVYASGGGGWGGRGGRKTSNILTISTMTWYISTQRP